MSLNFHRELHTSTFRDPRQDFRENTAEIEVRLDPITGESARVFPLHGFKLKRQEWAPLAALTREKGCPFCPEAIEKATPMFPEGLVPEGRIHHGGATVIPNLSPYAPYSGVIVMSPEHYLPLAQFPSKAILDGFSAALTFLRQAQIYDRENAVYPAIGWNYMPFAGGSIIHPHIQALAGPEPTSRHRLLLSSSLSYHENWNRNCWEELVDQEKRLGERYLWQKGNLHWLASFAPRGLGDLTIVFAGKSTLQDLTPADLKDLADGLQKVFRFYDSIDLPSFNFALYPAPHNQPGYWLHARITGRFTAFERTSDINSLQLLLGDFYSFLLPEEIADKIRP